EVQSHRGNPRGNPSREGSGLNDPRLSCGGSPHVEPENSSRSRVVHSLPFFNSAPLGRSGGGRGGYRLLGVRQRRETLRGAGSRHDTRGTGTKTGQGVERRDPGGLGGD